MAHSIVKRPAPTFSPLYFKQEVNGQVQIWRIYIVDDEHVFYSPEKDTDGLKLKKTETKNVIYYTIDNNEFKDYPPFYEKDIDDMKQYYTIRDITAMPDLKMLQNLGLNDVSPHAINPSMPPSIDVYEELRALKRYYDEYSIGLQRNKAPMTPLQTKDQTWIEQILKGVQNTADVIGYALGQSLSQKERINIETNTKILLDNLKNGRTIETSTITNGLCLYDAFIIGTGSKDDVYAIRAKVAKIEKQYITTILNHDGKWIDGNWYDKNTVLNMMIGEFIEVFNKKYNDNSNFKNNMQSNYPSTTPQNMAIQEYVKAISPTTNECGKWPGWSEKTGYIYADLIQMYILRDMFETNVFIAQNFPMNGWHVEAIPFKTTNNIYIYAELVETIMFLLPDLTLQPLKPQVPNSWIKHNDYLFFRINSACLGSKVCEIMS